MPPTPAPVAVVIVSWNDADDALRCARSVLASDYPALQLVVVDNGSRPAEAEELRRGLPDVPILRLPTNLGFTGGSNAGIRAGIDGGAELVVLVNSDAELETDTIARLVDAAAACPRAALIGAVILNSGSDDVLQSDGGRLDDRRGPVHDGMGGPPPERDAPPHAVEFVSGCVVLARVAALSDIGLLDEDYFAYYEDVDWSSRARRAGYDVMVAPAARAWHPDVLSRDEKSPAITYYMARNSLLFARKHEPRRWPTLTVRHLRTLASWHLRPRWRSLGAQRQALLAALVDDARGYRGAWRHGAGPVAAQQRPRP